MVERVSETGGGKDRGDQAKLVVFFEIAQKGGVKEKVHQQLLEIKIVAIKKFGNRARGQRPVRVSQRVEACQAAARDDSVPKNGQRNNAAEATSDQAGPAKIAGRGNMTGAKRQSPRIRRKQERPLNVMR